MKLSLHGQSTVAVEAPKGRIVIDPCPFSDLSCLEGAGAVLLTHAHGDHLDADAVRATGLPVWGTQEAIDALGSGTIVHAGEPFTVLGLEIHAVGGLHEEIHPNIPRPENLGYYFDGVLLLPIAGPWVRGADAADYAMRIGARVTVPMHDAVLSDVGKHVTDGMLQRAGVTGYQRLAPGHPSKSEHEKWETTLAVSHVVFRAGSTRWCQISGSDETCSR